MSAVANDTAKSVRTSRVHNPPKEAPPVILACHPYCQPPRPWTESTCSCWGTLVCRTRGHSIQLRMCTPSCPAVSHLSLCVHSHADTSACADKKKSGTKTLSQQIASKLLKLLSRQLLHRPTRLTGAMSRAVLGTSRGVARGPRPAGVAHARPVGTAVTPARAACAEHRTCHHRTRRHHPQNNGRAITIRCTI
jgi:hypothetical protein